MKKTYLFPRHMRFGAPVINFVLRDEYGYWLGTHCEEDPGAPKESKGFGDAYFRTATKRISRKLYLAMIAESKQNHRKYKVDSPVTNEELLAWAKFD